MLLLLGLGVGLLLALLGHASLQTAEGVEGGLLLDAAKAEERLILELLAVEDNALLGAADACTCGEVGKQGNSSEYAKSVRTRTLASRDGCLDISDGEAGIHLDEVGAVCEEAGGEGQHSSEGMGNGGCVPVLTKICMLVLFRARQILPSSR